MSAPPHPGVLRAQRADPVKRYLITTLLVIGVPGMVLAWLLGSFVAHRLNNHLLGIAGAEVESFVEGLLPSALGGRAASAPSPTDQRWWDDFGARMMRNPQTLAVRAYDAEGHIVYANNADLVGMRPSGTGALNQALDGQRSTRLDASLLSPLDRRFTVLVPITFGPEGPKGAIEVVQDFRSLRNELSLARWLIVGGVAALALLFLAALLPLTRRLARSAFLDTLTQLPNRRYLEEASKVVLSRNSRFGSGAALLLVDLDRFKVINDTLGHRAGDALLRTVAERLQEEVRTGDYVARQGGDEFALLLSGLDATAAHAAASRISDMLEQPVAIGHRTVRANASIGIALYPRDGADLETLLQHAEIAMYQAKAAKVPFEAYRPDLNPYHREGLFLESELRDAIENDGLELAFQAIRDLDSGRTVAAEALVRWNHPQRGHVAPAEFVSLAEETGLVRRIDRWVLWRAMETLAAWHAAGHDLFVSVNLSPQSAADPGLLEDLGSILAGTGAPPERLVLEVTERTAIADLEGSAGILEGARIMGLQIALDDFGTGYSSLATLDRLPISFIKIDQAFVHGIGRTPKDEHLIRAIAGFSRGMGIPIVAEGIETAAQQTWLQDEGIRLGQGYLLARPGAAAAVLDARQPA